MTTHSFIITYDTTTNEWYVDNGDMEYKYPDGNIWDTETETWNHEYLGDGKYYPMAEQVSETITNAVEKLNEQMVEGK